MNFSLENTGMNESADFCWLPAGKKRGVGKQSTVDEKSFLFSLWGGFSFVKKSKLTIKGFGIRNPSRLDFMICFAFGKTVTRNLLIYF